MLRPSWIFTAAVALAAAACAHDGANSRVASRGEVVGVNSVPGAAPATSSPSQVMEDKSTPVTGGVATSAGGPAPTAMATTTAPGR